MPAHPSLQAGPSSPRDWWQLNAAPRASPHPAKRGARLKAAAGGSAPARRCSPAQARADGGVHNEYYGASSPESSCRGTPGQEKFAAVRTRTPAKRLLVFDGKNTSHDAWGSASSGTSDDETGRPGSATAKAHALHEGDDQARMLLDRARAVALSELQGVGGKTTEWHAAQENGDRREDDPTNVDDTFMGDLSGDLSAIMRVASSDLAAEQARARGHRATEAREPEPELHDVTDRLWDFAQHIDRIEKHTVALRRGSLCKDQALDKIPPPFAVLQQEVVEGTSRSFEQNTPQDLTRGKSAGSPMRSSLDSSVSILSQNDLRGSFNSTSANVEKTATDVKRLCSDFKKNERGEEDIRKIMATAELHLSMLEKELLSRIDLDGSRKNGKRGEKQSSNERSPLKKAEKREVGTRNETQTPTRQRQTSVNKQSRAWEEQAFNAQHRRAPRDKSKSPKLAPRSPKSPQVHGQPLSLITDFSAELAASSAVAGSLYGNCWSPQKSPNHVSKMEMLDENLELLDEDFLFTPSRILEAAAAARSTGRKLDCISPELRHAVTKAASLEELLELAARQEKDRDGDTVVKTLAADIHTATLTATGRRRKTDSRATEMPLEQRLLLERQLQSQEAVGELQAVQQKSPPRPQRSNGAGKGVYGKMGSVATPGGPVKASENGKGTSRSRDVSPSKGPRGLKESDIDLWVGLASSCADESALLERARAMAMSELLGDGDDARSSSPGAEHGRQMRGEGGLEVLASGSEGSRRRRRRRAGAGDEGHEQRVDEQKLKEEDLRARLTRYFHRYNPARLTDVETLVVQFMGREAVLSVLLRQKYGGNLVLRDRHTDLSCPAMTPEEKEAKMDLQRDRDAMRYAEFFCRDKCYARSDHARISPYHSSRLKPVLTSPDAADSRSRPGSSRSSTTNANSPRGAGTRTPPSTRQKLAAWDSASSCANSAVMSSHMWPLQKLVQPDARQQALNEAGSWSTEQVAVFLSQTNARYLTTEAIEGMRRKGLDGLALVGATNMLLLHRYGLHSHAARVTVLNIAARLRSHLGIDCL